MFAAMFGGSLVGTLIGVLYNGVILGQRVPAITLALALLGESFVGARYARRALGRPLTADQRTRLAVYYSVGLAAIISAFFAWKPRLLPLPLLHRIEELSGAGIAVALGVALLAVGATALLRYLLLSLFAPRR
jgi:hypothetical protein